MKMNQETYQQLSTMPSLMHAVTNENLIKTNENWLRHLRSANNNNNCIQRKSKSDEITSRSLHKCTTMQNSKTLMHFDKMLF